MKFVTAPRQGHRTVAAKKREEGSACPCVVGGVKIFEGVYGWDLLWESGNAKFILMMWLMFLVCFVVVWMNH